MSVIGQTVSHYRILSKLGEGGMGVVYKALDTTLDRHVAIKFLPSQLQSDDQAKRRFIREAKAASSLNHANIAVVHEIDETPDGQMFIVMAYYEGQTLKARLRDGALGVQEAITVVSQIASGLGAAHGKGILHRDIKAANVLMGEDGQAKLADFGLAMLAGESRVTRTGTTVGTVAYMSPEQIGGGSVDARTDVWSLGVLLYELVAGRLPFKGDVEPALVYSIMNAEPDTVTDLRREAPAGLNGIIARALAKRVEDRYPDAESLRDDLMALLNDPEAFPAGIPVRRASRRRRIALSATAVVVVAAAASPFVIPRLVGQSQAITSLAILPVANLSGDSEQDTYAAGMHVELISTLGKIDNLVVLGRRSVLKYANSDQGPQEIAAELGVDALMEGSLSLVGDQIHIAAELVKASTGEILWTDTYDGSLGDAVNIQRRIALAVASGIHARLAPELEQTQASRVDPEAYRLYLKYRANWSSSEAIATLQRAVEIDSTFAEAWAALSHRVSYSAQYGHVPQDEGYELARTAAERAIALDPTLGQAHTAMATVYWMQDWDWGKSLEATERAEALNPTGTKVRSNQAGRLFMMGRIDEGIALYEESIALAPLNPDLRQVLGWHLWNIGRFDLAIDHLERNLELFPDHYFSNMLLALAYAGVGEYEKAVAQRKKMEQMYEFLRVDANGDSIPEKGVGPRYGRGGGTGMLVRAYANTDARGELVEVLEQAKVDYEAEPTAHNAWLVAFYLIPLGQSDEAREWLALSAEGIKKHMEEGAPRAAEEVLEQAYLYSSLGDKDGAFEWLNLAFEMRAAGLMDLYRRAYRFAELWDDPRYEGLMRRRGFPEEVIVSLRR